MVHVNVVPVRKKTQHHSPKRSTMKLMKFKDPSLEGVPRPRGQKNCKRCLYCFFPPFKVFSDSTKRGCTCVYWPLLFSVEVDFICLTYQMLIDWCLIFLKKVYLVLESQHAWAGGGAKKEGREMLKHTHSWPPGSISESWERHLSGNQEPDAWPAVPRRRPLVFNFKHWMSFVWPLRLSSLLWAYLNFICLDVV